MNINAIIIGATGMVGKGVLLECLENESVDSVLIISRQSVNIKHAKLKEIIHKDFFNLKSIQANLQGYNACFFCLGITSFRTSEEAYTRITHDLSVNFAKALAAVNKNLTFCFVSGTGADGTEQSKTMWARVKGKAENAILSMPFSHKYIFRPAFIYPKKGIKSKTKLYNVFLPLLKMLYPIFKLLIPKHVTTTSAVGTAMIKVVSKSYEKQILENSDINIAANR